MYSELSYIFIFITDNKPNHGVVLVRKNTKLRMEGIREEMNEEEEMRQG
jgi:hypothetical protein